MNWWRLVTLSAHFVLGYAAAVTEAWLFVGALVGAVTAGVCEERQYHVLRAELEAYRRQLP